jgi:D-alanine-D-alanine ligase
MSEPLIWALIPYFIEDGRLDGDTYESEETKAELASAFRTLGFPWIWQPVVPGNINDVVSQMVRSRARQPVLAFNLCDGFDTDGSPGISVVRALEAAGVPFTGADSQFYEISSSKLRMKELLLAANVSTPCYEVLADCGPVQGVCDRLGIPVIVKPDLASASLGISLRSRVTTDAAIADRRNALKNGGLPRHFVHGKAYAERFVDGREFTVFLVGHWRRPTDIRCFPPTERVFDETLPPAERFLSCDRYWAWYREESPPPSGNYFFSYEAVDPVLGVALSAIALRAYTAVRGAGYGRVDIRMENATGELMVLEVNANPEIAEGSQTTTGSILQVAGMGFSELIGMILEEALLTLRTGCL